MNGGILMRKIIKILGLAMVLTAILVVAVAGTAFAAGGPQGPAPNSGDCIPDGRGFESLDGTNQDAGDCVPDNCILNDYSYSHSYLTPGPH
jgi:hypothetical protein